MKKKMTQYPKSLIYLLLTVLLAACGTDTTDTRELRALLEKGDYAAAEAKAGESLTDKSDPANKELLLMRGVARYEQEKFYDALYDFNAYIKLDNTNYKAYLNRGLTNAALQQWREATEDYSAGIGLAPQVADLYLNRGQAYFEMQRYGEALADMNKALDRDAENSIALYNRGYLHYNMSQWKKAENDFEKLLDNAPEDANAHYGMGITQIGRGMSAEGCEYLRKAEKLGSEKATEAIAKFCMGDE